MPFVPAPIALARYDRADSANAAKYLATPDRRRPACTVPTLYASASYGCASGMFASTATALLRSTQIGGSLRGQAWQAAGAEVATMPV